MYEYIIPLIIPMIILIISIYFIIYVRKHDKRLSTELTTTLKIVDELNSKSLINSYLKELAMLNNAEKIELDKNIITLDHPLNLNITQKIKLLSTIFDEFCFNITDLIVNNNLVIVLIKEINNYFIMSFEDSKIIIGSNNFDKVIQIRKFILEKNLLK